MRKLAVIIPTFNEAENVGTIVSEVATVLQGIDYEIIIADDDSPDLTWKTAETLFSRDPRVRVLRRRGDRGLAAAVADGFVVADSEFVACIDGDLQHDPAILPAMLAAVEAPATIAVGSRYIHGGGVGNWSLVRRFASTAASVAASLSTGLEIKDPMSGYFLLRRSDFMRIQPELNLRGYKIMLEIVGRLCSPRITEVPYTFRVRCHGESKLGARVILDYFRQLGSLYVGVHSRKPSSKT